MSETTILKSCAINRNAAKSRAELSGPLPVVQVSMTANGPQLQGGQQARPVVVTSPKGRSASAGASAHPMIQVKMGTGGPQVQRNAVPPTSQPRGIARALVPSAPAPAPEAFTADQLMLLRHLVDKYLGELRAGLGATPEGEAQESSSVVVNLKLAEATIASVDREMLARTAAEAEAIVDAPTTSAPAAQAPARSGAPLPRVLVGPRSVQAGAVTPRRVARQAPIRGSAGGPPPMVSVRMDGERPVVQDSQPPTDLPTDVADAIDVSDGAPAA